MATVAVEQSNTATCQVEIVGIATDLEREGKGEATDVPLLHDYLRS